ncbi:YppE family protein [Evansella sp. AB-P1]|uniref:YppE family protein n=1 Tax=Evansella sp. AB-P1 TaxID=3037653 RepID=UPI00241D82DA|nr:YppE family protein [Evansella sp. AB-P1]MDG5787548.1 YppE family protein [Evansella sp. AB-P1]
MTIDQSRLRHLTESLLVKNKESLKQFEITSVKKEKVDFEMEIKPFADEVKYLTDEWFPLAIAFVENTGPKYLHKNQLEDIEENIQIEAVTCFQVDTKKKRFIERNKSIAYTLTNLLQALNK